MLFSLRDVRMGNILHVHHLDLEERQTTCIHGESGSGKTTLLKILNHLVDYQQGTVTYRGEDLKNLDAIDLRRKVVLVPQTPVIFPGNVKDNLLIGVHFSQKKPPSETRAWEEMRALGLNVSEEQDASSLSGGEKQRLALARAFLMDPEVLLLDEPTSALDEETEEKVINRIKKYTSTNTDSTGTKGKNLILVTHHQNLAERIAHTLITLRHGKVHEIVNPENEKNLAL